MKMPACARKEIVRPEVPGIFHCYSRCVRRAFLLGIDPLTGKDHNHRRQWLIERLELLVSNFVIDVAFVAVMSNHFHLILRTSPRMAKRMGAHEIARRWLRVYPGKRVLDGKWIEPTEQQIESLAMDKKRIEVLRKRLSNVSFFMSALSEYMARRCNLEDSCSGRFFEGRFGCRAIENEGGLLIGGMYLDLNQIRAGEAKTPEESTRCSVWFRIQARMQSKGKRNQQPPMDRWLAPLTLAPDDLGDIPSKEGHRASDKGLLSMSLDDYLRLLDWAGREVRSDKRHAIPHDLAPILERLGMEPDELATTVAKFPGWFRRFVGDAGQFEAKAKQLGRKSLHGVQQSRRVFRSPKAAPTDK